MDLRALVKRGMDKKPPRIIIHGVGGTGKTTWASQSPNPIFIQTEDGLGQIDVAHFPLSLKLDDVWEQLGLLIKETHDYKTLVLDSIDQFERLAWAQVCNDKDVKNINEIGWSKGYGFAMEYYDKLFSGLDQLRGKGMLVIIIAHSEIKSFSPPDGESYDRYQIKLHKHFQARAIEWADLVAYVSTVVFVDGDKRKAVGTGERVLHLSNKPAWQTKNRYSTPDELPLKFNELLSAIKGVKK